MADIKSSYQIKARLKQKIINHKQRLESISSFLKEYKDYCFEDREGIEKKLALSKNLNTEGARPISAQPPGQIKDSRSQYLKNNPAGEGSSGVSSVLAVTKQDDQLKLNMFGSAPKLEDKFMMNEKGRISRDAQPTAGDQNTARSASNHHKPTVVDSPNQLPPKDIPIWKNKKHSSTSVSQFHTLSKGNSENFEFRHTITDLKQMSSLSKARSQSQQSSENSNNSRNLKTNSNLEESQPYGSTTEQKTQIKNSPSKLETQKKDERRKSYFLQEANMKQAETENHGSFLKRHIQSASSYSLRVQIKEQEKKTKPLLAMQDEYFASTGEIKNNSLNSKNHIKFEITEENQSNQPAESQNALETQGNVLDSAEKYTSETNTITPQDSPKKTVSIYLHEGGDSTTSANNMDRKLKKLNLQSLLEKNNLSQQNKNSNQFIPSLAGINMHSSLQTPSGNQSSRNSYHNAIYGDSEDHLEAFSKQFLNSKNPGNFTNYPRFNTLDVLNTNEDVEIPIQPSNELNSLSNQPNNNEPQQNNDQEKKTSKPKKFRNSIFTEQFKKTFQSNLRQIQFRALKKSIQVNDIQQSIAKHIQDSTIKHFLEENSLLKKQAAAKALPQKIESTPASIRQVLKTVFNTSSSDILAKNRLQNSASPIKGSKIDQSNNNNANNTNNVPLLQKFAFTNRAIGSRLLEQSTPLSNQLLVKYHSNYVSSSESATKSPTTRDNHQEAISQQKTNDRSRASINSLYLKQQQLSQLQPSSSSSAAQQQMRPLYKFQEMMKSDNLHRDYADSARSLPSLVSMKSEGTAIQIKLSQGSNNNLHSPNPSDSLFNFVPSLKIHDPTSMTSNAFEGLSEGFSPSSTSWEPHSALLSRTKNKIQQLSQKNLKPSLKLKRI